MPKVSIYVPDPLYAEIRERKISLSAIAQQAFEEAVRRDRNAAWVAAAGARAPRIRETVDTAALLDEVREEFGA